MRRVVAWVLIGVGVALVGTSIATASTRVRGDRGADCGTAYNPSELVGYRPVEASAGCADAFDTIQPLVVGMAFGGVASVVAGAVLLLTGRTLAALLAAAVLVGAIGLWVASLDGNPVRNGAPALLLMILLFAVGGGGAVAHRLSQPLPAPRP